MRTETCIDVNGDRVDVFCVNGIVSMKAIPATGDYPPSEDVIGPSKEALRFADAIENSGDPALASAIRMVISKS